MAHGWKSGGRKKGTPNKRTLELTERLEALGCDPIEAMALIAMNRLDCGLCGGTGQAPDKEGQPCAVCHGKGTERILPELRARMYAELAQYLYPKRKAVEHSGPDGEAPSFRVLLEQARKRAGLDQDQERSG